MHILSRDSMIRKLYNVLQAQELNFVDIKTSLEYALSNKSKADKPKPTAANQNPTYCGMTINKAYENFGESTQMTGTMLSSVQIKSYGIDKLMLTKSYPK
jgi:hypothetical protein